MFFDSLLRIARREYSKVARSARRTLASREQLAVEMPPVSPVVAAKPAMPPPSMTYVDGKRRAALGKAQQQPPTSLSCCERCFCVKAEDRSNIASWMLKDTRDKTPPSACGKLLCFCDEAYPRTPNCIEEIPEIRALAGTVLEDGQALSGTVFTLRWMEFDKATRNGT